MEYKVLHYVREYGALELKRSYQRNLVLGTTISAAFLMIATLGLGFLEHTGNDSNERRIVVVRTLAQLVSPPPPPVLGESPSSGQTLPGGSFQSIPKAHETKKLSKGRYYGEIFGMVYDVSAAGTLAGGDSSGYIRIDVPSIKSLAKITLVDTDRMPECINAVLPPYPESAKKDRIEGEVWLQVLVDEHGDVGEVRVLRKSSSDVGFEQAAMDAALKWKYRPAVYNRKPVAVWIMYTLTFRLTSTNQNHVSYQGVPQLYCEPPDRRV
jgi:TonB family protein